MNRYREVVQNATNRGPRMTAQVKQRKRTPLPSSRLQNKLPNRLIPGHVLAAASSHNRWTGAASLSRYCGDVSVMRTSAQMHKQSPVAATASLPVYSTPPV